MIKAKNDEEKEFKKALDDMEKKNKSVEVTTPETLTADVNIGMSKVDPMDIRPPQILLVQKSSDRTLFVGKTGESPEIGQFFNTGSLEIMDEFECYIVFAGKSRYTDRRKPEEGEKAQYKAIGVLADEFSVFGMTYRSSALFALAPLFTAVVANKKPMYSIKVKIETKELTGEKGTWTIPVARVLGIEENTDKLVELREIALRFDSRADDLQDDNEEDR